MTECRSVAVPDALRRLVARHDADNATSEMIVPQNPEIREDIEVVKRWLRTTEQESMADGHRWGENWAAMVATAYMFRLHMERSATDALVASVFMRDGIDRTWPVWHAASVPPLAGAPDVLYSLDEYAEQLWAETPEEALGEADADDAPTRVYAWRRKVLTSREIDRYADRLLEALKDAIYEDDWSDPEEEHTLEPDFVESIRAIVRWHMPREHVWHCERAPELDVDLAPGPPPIAPHSPKAGGDA